MARPFKGVVNLDIRNSKPDWDAFLRSKAPKDAPNVLVILYDDTGQAAWSPYGGRIEMPTLDRLAKNGLTYTQWHTTSVCSPTRSTFLTGRNHHQNGFGTIAESAAGFPGYCGHRAANIATMATVLRDAGWSTFWIGKNHNVPVDAFDMASSRKYWPLGLGYDRFYGFIGGETNQWYPELIEDNHFVEQPYQPEDGYHFSKDIADKAINFIRDSKQSQPEKPWYLWYCPGANHAPHHAPQDYIDKYKGKFDDGYEAYREWVLKRMIERGILPKGTELTPLNPDDRRAPCIEGDLVRPWDSAFGRREKAVQPHGRGLCGLLRIHRRADRPADRLSRRVRPARQHADPLLRRQRRLGRRQPERLGQREPVLQRLSRRHRIQPRDDRQARLARHLQSLSDWLGGGVLDALPHVQALFAICRRHLRSARSSIGRRASRRRASCATNIITAPTSCRPSSTAAASSSRTRWTA